MTGNRDGFKVASVLLVLAGMTFLARHLDLLFWIGALCLLLALAAAVAGVVGWAPKPEPAPATPPKPDISRDDLDAILRSSPKPHWN